MIPYADGYAEQQRRVSQHFFETQEDFRSKCIQLGYEMAKKKELEQIYENLRGVLRDL